MYDRTFTTVASMNRAFRPFVVVVALCAAGVCRGTPAAGGDHAAEPQAQHSLTVNIPSSSPRAAPAAAKSDAAVDAVTEALRALASELNSDSETQPISEELFIAYSVRQLYTCWPDPARKTLSLEDQIAACKAMAGTLRTRAWTLHATELGVLADQAMRTLVRYEDFLASQDLIDKAVRADKVNQSDRAMYGIMISHGMAVAQKLGGWGIAISIVISIADSIMSSTHLSDAEASLLEHQRSRMKDELESQATYFDQTIRDIKSKYRWRPEDIDFSLTAVRGRDPFQIHDAASPTRLGDTTPATALADGAAKCILAASLIPSDPAEDGGHYKQFVGQMLDDASSLMLLASSKEWIESGKTFGGQIAAQAVRVCRLRLQYAPDTSDNLGHYELLCALHYAGQHAEALDVAMNSAGVTDDPHFAYLIAAILSMNERYTEALAYLERDLAAHSDAVTQIRADPAWAGLRRAMPQDFDELTAVRVAGAVTWDWLLHDYSLTNNSKFPITGVTITVQVKGHAPDAATPTTASVQLSAASIKPGKTYRWGNAISGRQSRIAEVALSDITCDQQDRANGKSDFGKDWRFAK